MWQRKKLLSVYLVFALLVNLFLPSAFVSANEVPMNAGITSEEGAPTSGEVSEPGTDQEPGAENPEPGAENPEPGGENPEPGAENPEPGAENPVPGGENPEPGAENPEPGAENPEPGTENPQPGTENPQPGTENPQPGTENPQPGTENPGTGTNPVPDPPPPPPPPAPPVEPEKSPENIITKVAMKDEEGNNITEIRPDQGSMVKIIFDWHLPEGHTYKGGDTFTFDLPDKFKVDRLLDGPLTGDVGTFEVTPEGTVTFTFSEDVENDEFVGTFEVWRTFDESKFSGGTKQQIEFPFGETINVHFKANIREEMDKQGTAKKMNPSEIDWVVDFNKGEQKITGATFQDSIPAGLELVSSSVEVYELEVMLDGSVRQGSAVTIQPTVSGNQFQLVFGDIDKAYRVKYKTNILEAKNTTYTNNVSVTGGSYAKDDSASVSVAFSEPLAKKSLDYKSSTQTLTWSIEYNYNEQVIAPGSAWIVDTFETEQTQEFLKDTLKVYEVTIDENGKATRGNQVASNEYIIDDTVPNGFKLDFPNGVQSAYEIIYDTKAKDRVRKSVNVTNKAEMYDGTTKQATKGMYQVIFWKDAKNEDINYSTKTILWKMYLNYDNYQMDEVVITDHYKGQGIELDKDSLKISGLTEGTDYTIEPINNYREGFTIKFNHPISTKVDIEYKTKFDPNYFNAHDITNHGKLTWLENGVSYEREDSATVSSDRYTKNNGNKTGTYNPKTKTITWIIDVNYNLQEINQAVIKDFYQGEQTFVKESLKVNRLNLQGGADQVEVKEELPSSAYSFEGGLKNSEGHEGFALTFKDPIDSAYRITYQTSLKGHEVLAEYMNDATMSDGGGPALFAQSASVKPKHGGEYILKQGKQGTGADAENAFWTIYLNRNQSWIDAGAKVTDKLSDNQVLLPESFQLYQTVVDANGVVSKGEPADPADYELKVLTPADGEHSFELIFKKPIESAYILEYKSFIIAENGEYIKNSAAFAGRTSLADDGSGQGGIKVSLSGAGGGAFPAGKAFIKIVKTDAASGELLAGATFELYDKTGKMLLETLVTDEQGVAVTKKKYSFKEYVLKEKSAPSGYLVDEAYASGKLIAFKEDKEISVTNQKGDWSFKLTKVDSEDGEKKLEGAVFKLQRKNGDKFEDVADHTSLVTDANGELYLAKLEPGDYQLIETSAPKGYKLDETPIPFTIRPNQTAVIPWTMKNVANRGSVELVKVDEFDHNITLAGAVFELRDADGKTLQSNLSTDENGKLVIPDLKAGKYQFVEITAPTDYLVSQETLEFEIVNEGEVVQKIFTNKLIPGSATLTKVDSNRPDVKLEGAQFRVLDENKKPILSGLSTDKNGELHVPDLRPGLYYFEETRAPSGYVIKDRLTEFEIKKNEITTVTIGNVRYSGGGGGGTPPVDPPNPPVDPPNPPVDPPNPPVDPPNPPVDPPNPPVDPEKPEKPEKPGKDKPDRPDRDEPEEKPEIPGVPSKPSKPGEPSMPEVPVTPTPVEPTPEKPVDPAPVTPVDPEPTTPSPSVPTSPTKPVEKVDKPVGSVKVPEGGTATIGKQPKHGTVTVDPSGKWVYTPNGGKKQKDSFSIIVKDKDGNEEEMLYEVDGDVPTGGIHPDKAAKKVLPKTGEESHLPLQLAGAGLIVLGAWLYRRTRSMRNM
ncbi:collagen binding domain-containing protein [Brevibacillus borstelensis]|jgi:LPXTG-motif cell wall-anchored protein|uniref:collagen binding domain-containing protein n=1 Tax=Brevibacillus borstelensis TaxID=45462 RepID=UPI00242C6FF9|nr:collagen binding domain-containing protein [Brevibacillus borstelensis]